MPSAGDGGVGGAAAGQTAACRFLFQKELTCSDTNVSGRIILPRIPVEAHFPYVPAKEGIRLDCVSPVGSPSPKYSGALPARASAAVAASLILTRSRPLVWTSSLATSFSVCSH